MNRKSFIKTLGFTSLPFFMKPIHHLEHISNQFSTTERMPLLFLGHGSPMNAIEENQFVKGFRDIAKTIPKPNAILCISAHWYTRGTKVTAMEMPKTIYDFGGFPEELFQVKYPAHGSPELAKEVKELLVPTSIELDESWGLDHGAWSAIKHLYPDADIPVIQMSIDYTMSGTNHFDLAKKLTGLREKGILIIGSGNIIHNLGLIDFRHINTDNYGYDWAIEAHSLINNYIIHENFNPLLQYETLGKAVQLAIPTPDHYLPLLYILGLKKKEDEITLFNDKLLAGSLSMTSLRIG